MKVVRRTFAALQPVRVPVALCLLCALAACSFDDSKNKWLCKMDADCAIHGKDYVCSKAGFCVKKPSQMGKGDASAGDGATSGSDGATDAATKDGATTQQKCTKSDFCFDDDAGLTQFGACRTGMHQCENGVFGDCLGEVLPTDETCNDIDDDCDGKTDEKVATGSCVSDAQGACNMGTLTCNKGVMRCQTAVEPGVEVCDGIDNDCDGKTDEGTDALCYPSSTPGCGMASDPASCTGVCKLGMRVCTSGVLGDAACNTSGAVTPETTDGCSAASTTAADDDCDGMIDEDCSCSPEGSTQECYTGSPATKDVGECLHGTQTCTGGKFGACVGAIMPAAETCANQGHDDDCNGTKDDVPGKGDSCIDMSKQGICRTGSKQCVGGTADLTCVTLMPAAMEACDGRDDDCDGTIDNGFDLQTDPMHCGSCTNVCGNGQSCCSGHCVDTKTDDNHCGMCAGPTAACGSGRTCCDGSCQSLQTDKNNCGTCGHKCAGAENCCGGQCVNTLNNHENCHACGSSCFPNETCCAGSCVDVQLDSTNCGTCGKSCKAVVGICQCQSGGCAGLLGGICL
jgi:hypothetical protein